MEKETSCINAKAILDYVKVYKGDEISDMIRDLDPELDRLPDPVGFLTDHNNWISCEVMGKLYERARTMLKDDMAAYKAAKLSVENISLGYAQSIIVKTFWSVRRAVKHAQKINDKFNRNKRVELVELRRNNAVIRLHWLPHLKATKDMCLNNQGVSTFLPIIWGGKPLALHEKCCFFEGAPFCEYHLRWPMRNRFHEIFSRLFTSKSVLMEIIGEMEEGKEIIERKYEEVNQLNTQLHRKIKQLMAIQETGKAILSMLDLEPLLTVIMNLLADVCQINRALIMLTNENEGCLEYVHGMGFQGEVPEEVKKYRVPLSRISNMLARVTNTGRAEYIPEVKRSGLKEDNVLLAFGKPTSIYVVPLITRSKVIGIIATDAVDGNGVPEETRDLLGIFASQIAIAIENARLYQTLHEQMEQLKRSQALLNRAEKFSFLGNLAARLAHEIKNPMTAIGTFIQLLPKKYDDVEFRSSFYRIAMEETQRVNNLVTELLDLVKTKESHFEPSDLHALIDKMVLLLSPQSKAKNITVFLDFDPRVGEIWMDPEKMKQVILNILANALEFSPDGGRIEVTTRVSNEAERCQSVCIEIKDYGIGVPAAVAEKVFDPYFTTKHKSKMHSGTGLGLFIAHQNVHDLGGSIEVRSGEKEGATFIVTLPLKRNQEEVNSAPVRFS
ncbi:MAG: GAF domain-containing protein [Desulfobacteraceae bacterium]|nr:MAG: GAF domain-containing protein [Desulfobacteraceae bacterium]